MAHAEDGTDVQIGWMDGSGSADGFLIEASSDAGVTFSPLGIAPAANTFFLATGLGADMNYVFKVIPFNAAGAGTAAVSPSAHTGDYADVGAYQISFGNPVNPNATSETFSRGSEGDTENGTLALVNSGWIQADSVADAARQALNGSLVDSTTGHTYYYGDDADTPQASRGPSNTTPTSCSTASTSARPSSWKTASTSPPATTTGTIRTSPSASRRTR